MKLLKARRITAVYSDHLILKGLSEEEKSAVKSKLTFNNPQFEQVQKYSKWSSTRVSPYLFYYREEHGDLIVPIGFDISFLPSARLQDSRCFERVAFPSFSMTLRDSQKEAAERYIEANKGIPLKGCVQMPTGKGKSILGLYLSSFYSCKTLIVVHKTDLIEGWSKDIAEAFCGKVKAGLIKEKVRRVGDQITLATVQTLNRLSEEELEELYDQFGFVIQDEAHHSPAASFDLVSNFRARYKLGITATPERSDGLTHIIPMYYGEFCYRYEYSAEDSDILPVQVNVRTLPVYFDPICEKNKNSYVVVDLEADKKVLLKDSQRRITELSYSNRPKVQFLTADSIVVRKALPFVLPDVLSEFSAGKSILLFILKKEDCRMYYDALVEEVGEENVALYYGDNNHNSDVLRIAEEKKPFITISTYAKATEGTNVRQWEVAFLISSMNNEKNTEQAVGRIRRIKEGKNSVATVYDYRYPNAYMFSSHGYTRDKRYRALHFKFVGEDKKEKKPIFSRGYK